MTQNTENSMETTRAVGRPFPKGVSRNPRAGHVDLLNMCGIVPMAVRR